MTDGRAIAQIICFILLSIATFYALLQTILILAFHRRHILRETACFPGKISVLRPLLGADSLTYETLAALYRQTRRPDEIRYAIDSEADPAHAVVERLQKEFPDVPVKVYIGGTVSAPNRKVAKLALLSADCDSDILIAMDQDILVAPQYLEEVSNPFSDPKVGLVTSLYRQSPPSTIASALELLAIHCDFFPSVLVAEFLEKGLGFAFGASMAISRQALDAVGGFQALTDYLADDHEMGARMRKKGYRVILSPLIVEHNSGRLDFRTYVDRGIRANRTYRVCRPIGYSFSVLTQGLPWIAIAASCKATPFLFWSLSLVWVFARLVATITSHFRLTKGKGPWWPFLLLPGHEAARFLFWGLAFLGKRVKWGKRLYAVDSDGRMREIGKDQSTCSRIAKENEKDSCL